MADEAIEQIQGELEAAEERHQTELRQREEQNNVEMVRLREAHEENLHQKDTQLEQQMMTIQQLNVRLREKDERLRRREEELQEQLQQKETQLQLKDMELQRRNADISRLQSQLQTPLRELTQPLNLTWRRGEDMPFKVWDYPQAVVFKGKVYIGGGGSGSATLEQTVMVYDPQLDSFVKLLPYTCRLFSMAVVNNQLVLVGGVEVVTDKVTNKLGDNKKTNKLGVWNEQSKTWTDPYPSMTTACSSPSVVVYEDKWLIVIGGYGRTALSRVEILDTTEPGQWYIAAPLPQPCRRASTVIIGNTCYVVGGYGTGVSSRKVYSVWLDYLISQAVPQAAGTGAPSTPSPWTTMPDTLLTYSTALCLNGALMTVGGERSTTIYHYKPSTRRWIEAGELPTGRLDCACTVLSGELFVAGGVGFGSNLSVGIASI